MPTSSMPRFWPAGLRAVVRVDAAASAGAYALVEVDAPPGCAVARHVHDGEDEQVLVLDGVLEVEAGPHRRTCGAGDSHHLPAGEPHALAVPADAPPCRFLWLIRPAGLEDVVGKLAAGGLDDDDVAALLAAAGVTVLPAPRR